MLQEAGESRLLLVLSGIAQQKSQGSDLLGVVDLGRGGVFQHSRKFRPRQSHGIVIDHQIVVFDIHPHQRRQQEFLVGAVGGVAHGVSERLKAIQVFGQQRQRIRHDGLARGDLPGLVGKLLRIGGDHLRQHRQCHGKQQHQQHDARLDLVQRRQRGAQCGGLHGAQSLRDALLTGFAAVPQLAHAGLLRRDDLPYKAQRQRRSQPDRPEGEGQQRRAYQSQPPQQDDNPQGQRPAGLCHGQRLTQQLLRPVGVALVLLQDEFVHGLLLSGMQHLPGSIVQRRQYRALPRRNIFRHQGTLLCHLYLSYHIRLGLSALHYTDARDAGIISSR